MVAVKVLEGGGGSGDGRVDNHLYPTSVISSKCGPGTSTFTP